MVLVIVLVVSDVESLSLSWKHLSGLAGYALVYVPSVVRIVVKLFYLDDTVALFLPFFDKTQ